MKLVRIAAVALAAGALVALAGVGRPEKARGEASSPARRSITVTGTGSVTTVPDRAEFSFGVTTQGRTATQALNANAGEMRRVISALVAAGIPRADIQTLYVTLSPRYSSDGDEILGYTASNTVSARLRDLDKAGAVIDAAVAAGANQVYGPALTRSDMRALYRTALRAAVADAREKAEAIAAASHARLGPARTVVEGTAAPPPILAEPAKGRLEVTPIEPGTQRIEATVTVEFTVS